MQKVVEAVLEEEVEEDGGDVGLRHRLVHRGVVRRQQRRDQPSVKHRIIDNVSQECPYLHLASASLVLPRGGSRRPQVVITAAREGGLVNKA